MERQGVPGPLAPARNDGNARHVSDQRLAMRLSLVVGVAMLVGKVAAYVITGSAAILSDAAESVIHVVAVAFAAYSLSLSLRPANRHFRYGYERIAFFSAGAEGALIVIAALFIIASAVEKWLRGLELTQLGLGTVIVLGAALLNAGLGGYLVYTGKKTRSIILEANGKHVLTDSWTSFGVVGGLLLVLWTGWKPFDPIVAIAVAMNILWSGAGLVRRSVAGLMDYSDPEVARQLDPHLEALGRELGIVFHQVRFRHSGQRVLVELHVLFPYETAVGEAHRVATVLEEQLAARVPFEVEVATHIEALEDHQDVHRVGAH
jgi:cation diffusion facilitator family transporter